MLYTPGIVRDPQDIVLFTSHGEENVQFVCQFEFASITWEVNDSSILHLSGFSSRQTYSRNITTGTLTVPALVSYNQTRVKFIRRHNGKVTESSEAMLLYQGMVVCSNYYTVHKLVHW